MKFLPAFLLVLTTVACVGPNRAHAIDLCSPDIESDNCVPREFSCVQRGGEEHNPELKWSKVDGALSYIHMFDDPAANHYLHWFVKDIPPTTLSMARAASRDSTVPGVQLKDYRGNCPGGTNKYRYSIFAMKTATTEIELGTKRGNVLEEELLASGNVLEQASFRADFNGANGGDDNNCPLVAVPCNPVGDPPSTTPTPTTTALTSVPKPTIVSCADLSSMSCSNNGQFLAILECPAPCSTQAEFDTSCCATQNDDTDNGGSTSGDGGDNNGDVTQDGGAASSTVPTVVAAAIATVLALLC